LKRVTRSFTVEYRQAKRPNAKGTKLGWALAKPKPAGINEKASWDEILTFRAVAADLPAPSIATGRILPSLLQVAPATERVDAKLSRSRRSLGAAQSPADGALPGELRDQSRAAEDLETSTAVATTIPQLEHSTPSDRSDPRIGKSRSEKPTGRPAKKREKFDPSPHKASGMSKASPAPSTDLLLVDKPPSPSRTRRILDRYVFRDERGPGEMWKRRIETRRERRS
jgi:hypothetical protein